MVGNTPNYSKYDILRCFLRIDSNMGRQELAKELDLGEGTVRTILEILKSGNLLDSTKKGHFLSKNGQSEMEKMSKTIDGPKEIDAKSVYPEFKKSAAMIKISTGLKETYKLRDIAVKNDAEGALILKFDGKLTAPGSDYKGNFSELEKFFEFKKGNVLILAFAKNRKSAEIGAIAVASELNKELNGFIKKFD